jgi:TonB family protein
LSQTLRQALLSGAKADPQLVAILTEAEKRSSSGVATDATADTLVAEQPADKPVAPVSAAPIVPAPVELDKAALGKPETIPVAINESLLALNQPARSVDATPKAPQEAEQPAAAPTAAAEPEITAERILSEQLYVVELRKLVQKNLEYPESALSRGWEGSVRVQVTVARDGKLRTMDVEEEAKYPVLTEAVTKAIKRAAPFPEIPAAIDDSSLTFSMPVNFSLNDAKK